MNISVDSITGSCAYAFPGSKIVIESGVYKNETKIDYEYSTEFKALVLNQDRREANNQLIVVTGGDFYGNNPAAGDDNKVATTFLADGYGSTSIGDNAWRVVKKTEVGTVGDLKNALGTGNSYISLTNDITAEGIMEVTADNITVDLGGKTFTAKADTAFEVFNDNFVLCNGTIDETGYTGKGEVDAIWVNGATAKATLKDLNVSINNEEGACVYVGKNGGYAYIESGTYTNGSETYKWNDTVKHLLLNQANNFKDQRIFVTGGTFNGYNPANGDDAKASSAGTPTTFLAEGYQSVETSTGSGTWVVSKK